jgi:hypothetical protein
MKIGLVGGSYQQRSLPFDAQRTINLFPVFDDQGKEVASLYGTPGLTLFGDAGSGPIRGCFASANGRAFVVSGDSLYEISSTGTETLRGTLNTSAGNISIDENSLQLFICDGDDGYTLTYASNSFAVVSDADFPSAGTATYLDSYFIVNQNSTGRFFISAVNDGTTWDALDFATAESSPDSLVRVIRAVGQLWLLGSTTTEIWTNTGDASFPFQKIKGAEIEIGILAAHTAVSSGNSLTWVGKDNRGSGIVYRADGFRPKRISTEAIELLIARATDPTNMLGYAYQQDGHDYYVLTGGGLETSLCYDGSTNLWHERAYLNAQGENEQHLSSCCMFAFNKHLVGDRRNGNIYELDMEVYSDNGDAIARDRIYTHISNEGERVRYSSLEIGFETGVGLQSGQGSNPVCVLRISQDGARTWSDGFTASIGAVGEYTKKVIFRRLGIAEQLTFWVRVTDPVKVAITGSYLK